MPDHLPDRHPRPLLTPFLALAAALLACTLPSAPAAAQVLPMPRLQSVFPLGGQAGQSVEISVNGDALEGPQRLVFSHPGIAAEPVMLQPDRFYPEARPAENRFTVKVAADVPPGVYEVRLVNRMGITNARCFAVGDRPEALETEPNNDAQTATEIALDSPVNGLCDEGTKVHDYFRFTARQGQRLVLHCAAQRLDSRADVVLTLYDAQGAVLAKAHDPVRLDPTLDFTAPADGQYAVSVHDFQYRGGTDFPYRLTVSTAPWVEFVDPPFASPGAAGRHVLYGHNLPGSTPAEDPGDGGGPLEKLEVTIQAPADPSAVPPAADTLLRPTDGSLDTFSYRLPSPNGLSNPVRLTFVLAGTLTPEQEPNDSPDAAQALTLPTQIVGRFDKKGDRDWLTFDAKAGESLWLELVSQRTGLPTDPSIVVQRVVTDPNTGQKTATDVAEADDQVRQAREQDMRYALVNGDPALAFAAPEDGTYRVLVRDLYDSTQGGRQFAYVLNVRPAKPDFALLAYATTADAENNAITPAGTTLRKGGRVMVDVLVLRREGFDGPIRLEADPKTLPAGVTAKPFVVAGWSDIGRVVFEAAPDAATWAGPVGIVGRATVGGAEVARAARAAETLWTNRNGMPGPLPTRVVQQIGLAIADDLPAAPFSLMGSAPEGTVYRTARGGKLSIPVKVAFGAGATPGGVNVAAVGLQFQQMQAQPVGLDPGAPEKNVDIDVQPGASAGSFTIVMRGQFNLQYARSPEVAAKAAEDKTRIEGVLAQSREASQKATQSRQQAEQTAQQATQAANQAEQQRAAAEQASNTAAAQAKEAADRLAQLKAANGDAAQIAQAQTQSDDAAAKAKAAAEALATMVKAKEDAMKAAEAAEAARVAAVEAEKQAQEAAREAEQVLQGVNQRATQLQQMSQPQNVKYYAPSPPIAIEVVETPYTLKLDPPGPVTLKAGATDPLPIAASAAREFGFDDEIRFEIVPPNGVGGLSFAADNSGDRLAKGVNAGNLLLRANANTPPGTHQCKLRTRYTFNGRGMTFEQPFEVTVTEADKPK